MPRKSKTDEAEQPVERRSSSRLAAIPKPEPVAKSPPAEKPSARKRKSLPEDVPEVVEADKEVVTTPKKRGRPSKKAVNSPEAKPAEAGTADDAEMDQAKSSAADFELVNKESLPSPTSDEVKKACDAQGQDAELLVNFVQVSKDEIPSPNSEAIKEIAKQHVAPPPVAVAAEENSPVKKHAEELPAKEVHVSPGCNGNCEEKTVSNGVDLTGAAAKNGNHETTTTAATEPVDAPATVA